MEEGGYMPYAQRIKIAQKVRQTHFTLGNLGNNFQTTSRENYANSVEEVRYNRAKPTQSSPLHIGSDQNSMKTISETAERYRPHSMQPQTLQKKPDLRQHHFHFGSDKTDYQTIANMSFDNKRAETNAKYQPPKTQNLQFGQDKTQMESISRSDYKAKSVPRVNPGNKLQNQLTNFVMGSDVVDHTSTVQQDFAMKPAEKRLQVKKDNSSVICLGNDRSNMKSIAHESFTNNNKPLQQSPIHSNIAKDFRQAHFKLGSVQNDFTPLYKQEFSQKQPDNFNQPIKRGHETSFKLGTNANQWQSTYSSLHNNVPKAVVKQEPLSYLKNQSNILLGTWQGNQISTAAQDFVDLKDQISGDQGDAKLNQQLKDQIGQKQKQSFVLGTSQATYERTSELYGKAPNNFAERQRYVQPKTSVLQGSYPADYGTTQRRDFVAKPSVRAQPQKILGAQLVMGNDKKYWGTTYQGNFTGVKPVPDLSQEFSIQFLITVN